MKSWVIVLVSAASLGLMAEDAFAQRSRGNSSSAGQHRHHSTQSHGHHYYNHGHGHHSHGWVGAGIVFAPAYWPWYAYPYTPAPVYAAPPVVVEPAVAPSMNSGYWYFCPDTRAFYPHVMECRSGWQAMVPGSPPPN